MEDNKASLDSLLAAERRGAIGQVCKGIGHELGNVLLRIMGKIDLALLETDPAKIGEHLQVAMKASERAGMILRNLQSFSKIAPTFQLESLLLPVEEAISYIA